MSRGLIKGMEILIFFAYIRKTSFDSFGWTFEHQGSGEYLFCLEMPEVDVFEQLGFLKFHTGRKRHKAVQN
jgi:hypothetical protein